MIPPGPELESRNRHLAARRHNWPDGAAAYCDEIDQHNPGWHTHWRNARGDQPAGYYSRHDHHYHLEPHLYGRTAGDLQAAILVHRCREL